MENNEISMFMDVKLDIHYKQPDAVKFKEWSRCQVKIEAVKCVPCFLRVTIKNCENECTERQKVLTVSINVPGVTTSLAESRTKQHSYGLFWTQNRRQCYIYFALETDSSCRSHMKWIRKSVKNLELYRQVFLEQRRNSRFGVQNGAAGKLDEKTDTNKTPANALGPLPQIPDTFERSAWSSRYSRASEIYEEICEDIQQGSNQSRRVSRRCSRTSIASGIYEEMKPIGSNFNAIVEEALLPPTPPPRRKRVNTFATEHTGLMGEIPRSNTNPESELAKKKKYKNMLDNIFGSGRAKRAASVSESQACTVEDIMQTVTPKRHGSEDVAAPIYSNDIVAIKRRRPPAALASGVSKRNSFSSPDLTKLNKLKDYDDDDEQSAADMQQFSFSINDDFELSIGSLDKFSLLPSGKSAEDILHADACAKADSLESLNFSQQLPNNFNFSACNTSAINLIGASGAVPAPMAKIQKNKIVVDDLSGYCVMAPIIKKTQETNAAPVKSTESTSSGYSTGSYCSTSSTAANAVDEQQNYAPLTINANAIAKLAEIQSKTVHEESVVYEYMHGALDTSDVAVVTTQSKIGTDADFTGNLYENLLAVKAAQELGNATPTIALSTSTPTDSPLTADAAVAPLVAAANLPTTEESYYQTPRKSIISVDDKISSYYPNNCDAGKTGRRRSQSPTQSTTSAVAKATEKTTPTAKMQQVERKENLYIATNTEMRHNSTTITTTIANASIKTKKSLQKTKKTAAHKISENIYAVTHLKKNVANKNNNNNNNDNARQNEMQDKLQTDLLQLAVLQNIDFKFDDTKALTAIATTTNETPLKENAMLAAEVEAHSKQTPQRTATQQHHLQDNQALNTNATNAAAAMSQSKLELPLVSAGDIQLSVGGGIKKFASLPRFKKIDFSPLRLKINNVLQRNQQQEF